MGEMRRTFTWCKKAENLVRANLRSSSAAQRKVIARIAQLTGNPRDACFRFAHRLGFPPRPFRNWSLAEQKTLRLLHKAGYPLRVCALKLKRSLRSVETMQRRLGLGFEVCKRGYGKNLVAARLHVRPSTIEQWIDDGLIPSQRKGKRKFCMINAEGLALFLSEHVKLASAG